MGILKYMKSIKILLIEDDLEQVQLINQMLRASRYCTFQVVHESTLNNAISRITEEDFDVVVLNLLLQGFVGITITPLRELNAKLASKCTSIIVISALDDEKFALKTLKEGAQDYLIKGQFNSNNLIKAILYALERNTNQLINQDHYKKNEVVDSDIKYLTIREKEILTLISKGRTNKEISQELYVSNSTV